MSALRLFTSESVTEGHPDKISDQISDAVLDAMLTQDTEARVAVETLVTTGLVHVAGEVRTTGYVDIASVARKVIVEIGYDSSEVSFDGNSCGVTVSIGEQSPEIATGVDTAVEARGGSVDPLDREPTQGGRRRRAQPLHRVDDQGQVGDAHRQLVGRVQPVLAGDVVEPVRERAPLRLEPGREVHDQQQRRDAEQPWAVAAFGHRVEGDHRREPDVADEDAGQGGQEDRRGEAAAQQQGGRRDQGDVQLQAEGDAVDEQRVGHGEHDGDQQWPPPRPPTRHPPRQLAPPRRR